MYGTLDVTKATTLASTLDVMGATAITGATSITGATTFQVLQHLQVF